LARSSVEPTGLESADIGLSYDVTRLELLQVQRGSLTTDFNLFESNPDHALGTLRVGMGRIGPLPGPGGGSLMRLNFRIRAGAPAGAAVINLRQSQGGTLTQLNEGGLVLTPAPSNDAGDAIDGRITVLDASTPLPDVRSVVVNDGAEQHSRVSSLTITFGSTVRFVGKPVQAFRLVGPRGAVKLRSPVVSVDATGTQTVVRLLFKRGRGVGKTGLANGQYTLTIDGDRILEASGAAIDGDNDGVAGGDAVSSFFRLYGDSDGDRDVDATDQVAFNGAFGTRSGRDPGYLWFFDADANGRINSRDRRTFLRVLGSTI
jgi:hypothetical protein